MLLDNSFIILKYNVLSDRAPCTKLHKVEQKDRTKTLAEFPDHILNDYMIQVTFDSKSDMNVDECGDRTNAK